MRRKWEYQSVPRSIEIMGGAKSDLDPGGYYSGWVIGLQSL